MYRNKLINHYYKGGWFFQSEHTCVTSNQMKRILPKLLKSLVFSPRQWMPQSFLSIRFLTLSINFILAILGSLHFQINFLISLPVYIKQVTWNFIYKKTLTVYTLPSIWLLQLSIRSVKFIHTIAHSCTLLILIAV